MLPKFNFMLSRNSLRKLKPNFLVVVLFVGMLLIGNQAFALSFDAKNGKEGLPWLLVENSDLLFLGIVNLILLGLFLYLRGVFKNLINILKPKGVEVARTPKAFSKINTLLTDAVSVEDEGKITMDHDFDGIKELDNNLPPWWVAMFIATVIFAVVYLLHYHVFKTGDLQLTEYTKEMEKADADVKKYLSKMSMDIDENNATVLMDKSDLDAGKAIYDANCVMCHKSNGEGDIGPNLTDEFWIYTGDVKAIFKTIKAGTSNGMPEHASKLNPIQIQQVASYIWNLPYTPGKEPQGEKYVKE